MNWLADKIEQWPTAKLLPYARNARTHSEDQVAQIAASIKEFGFTKAGVNKNTGKLGEVLNDDRADWRDLGG